MTASGSPIPRREFHASLLALATAIGVQPALADNDNNGDTNGDKNSAPAAPPDAESNETPASLESATVDELLLAVVRRLYPDERLLGDVLDDIQGDIAASLYRGAVLGRVPLSNGDAPATMFRPLVPTTR